MPLLHFPSRNKRLAHELCGGAQRQSAIYAARLDQSLAEAGGKRKLGTPHGGAVANTSVDGHSASLL